MLGWLNDGEIAQRLSERPIFVSVSRYEPFGLAVLEAALAGCALVLSDIPTFRELWRGVANFVPADDAAAIAFAIRTLIERPALREKQGLEAAKRGASYSSIRMTRRMLALYAGVSPALRAVA
jgi:glycosyltransferase involved in cell wall biosynthesis